MLGFCGKDNCMSFTASISILVLILLVMRSNLCWHLVVQGFYYDAFYGELSLNEDHFKQIESGALRAVGVPFSQHLIYYSKYCDYAYLVYYE